jgi:hypothetical protein
MWTDRQFTRDELAELFAAGTINDYTTVGNVRIAKVQPNREIHGLTYSHLRQTIDIDTEPDPEEFLAERKGKLATVLSGPNNGGKTFFLKHLYSFSGDRCYLLACNRFSHVDTLTSRQHDEHEHASRYRAFLVNFESSRMNTEDNDLKLDQILTGLKDSARVKLFEAAEELLGNVFDMVHTDPENCFSPFQVMMDGQNLRYGSSGTRLLLTLLGTLLDERFTTMLLDEPEIGLSPRIQARLARFLYDGNKRAEFCPHLKELYIATHSHIFLDRSAYSNNFVVTKKDKVISARQVQAASDLHELQFNMLGNDLELLYLPAAIVLVEGETDALYLGKVVSWLIPGRKVAIVRAQGEGEVLKKINYFKESFGDLATSPYHGRLFVLYDKKITTSVKRIENAGVRPGNIIVLSMNGIEHYYPPAIVADAFHCTEAEVSEITLEDDCIDFNGHRYTNTQLAKFVVERLSPSHPVAPEIRGFIDQIYAVCQ